MERGYPPTHLAATTHPPEGSVDSKKYPLIAIPPQGPTAVVLPGSCGSLLNLDKVVQDRPCADGVVDALSPTDLQETCKEVSS